APGPQPFGANLFTGSYAAQREDGLNPDYRILPGDRVMVNAWGAVTINDIFAVDSQGNIFIPNIGPIRLEGVRNEDLTSVVRNAIARVYRGQFGVYTNLLTASPVAVFVTGGVRRPGRYAGIPSDSVLFFLDQAGGIDPDSGSYRHVKILRQGAVLVESDLYDFLLRGQLTTVQFSDGDVILVERRGPVVEVQRPGREPMLVELTSEQATGAEVLEIVARDGRVNGVTVRGLRDGHPTVRTMDPSQLESFPVRDGDTILLRQDVQPDTIVVYLEGEFRGPSQLAVRRGARLLDVLNYVPIDPELARPDAVYIRRQRLIEEQRRSLHESLDRLERAAFLAASDTEGESAIRLREAEMIRTFADRARRIEPLGRMVTTSAGRQLNVLLQDGDVIVIPPRTSLVRVVGEVQIPNAVQYRPDLRVADYVRMAGGYSIRANPSYVVLTHANAEVSIVGPDATVQPGDEIIIMPAIDDKWLQNGIDVVQAIYQIAVAASVAINPILTALQR
ncbi:MAG TPA: polysaccharide biosynthesis/export family protein, partial [Sandaracinaceae bacterium]